MDLTPHDLQTAIHNALNESRRWVRESSGEPAITNSLRSSMFCSQFGEQLSGIFGKGVTRRQILVDWDSRERIGGEWLLDIVWTEDEHRMDGKLADLMPRRIRCAVECESSTAGHEFFKDFAKLLNVRSRTKIFLGGLNQIGSRRADAYIKRRVAEAERYIRDYEVNSLETDWYIGFWPSPKGTSTTSLWDSLDGRAHLTRCDVYHYDVREGGFVHYTQGGNITVEASAL